MNGEILRLVDTIHRDKDIEKETIFLGVEACIVTAVKKKLGEESDVRVEIDRETGETSVYEEDRVVPISDLGRLAALQGKQVLFQKIREAERDRIYDEYESKLGKLLTGIVQRQEGRNLIINLGGGRVEGFLPRSEQAPGERFRVGERIKILLLDIKKNHRVRITLSRAHPDFVKALFELEVPEIAERVIEVMDIVREPGYRTKIAVTTYDHNVDCVGACVGVRGSRIKNIVDELFGEKIDIVRWNESIEVLIMNALKPAEITTMDLDYDEQRATVYVREDQQSLAIGRRGQNVRLASKLAGWELDIVTVSEADIERLRKGETPVSGGEDDKAAESSEGAAETAAADPAEATESSEESAETLAVDESDASEAPAAIDAALAEDDAAETALDEPLLEAREEPAGTEASPAESSDDIAADADADRVEREATDPAASSTEDESATPPDDNAEGAGEDEEGGDGKEGRASTENDDHPSEKERPST